MGSSASLYKRCTGTNICSFRNFNRSVASCHWADWDNPARFQNLLCRYKMKDGSWQGRPPMRSRHGFIPCNWNRPKCNPQCLWRWWSETFVYWIHFESTPKLPGSQLGGRGSRHDCVLKGYTQAVEIERKELRELECEEIIGLFRTDRIWQIFGIVFQLSSCLSLPSSILHA